MEDDPAKLVEELNTDSSKWLKTEGSPLQSCHWQNGHGGFSVSASQLEAVSQCIEQQEEHHGKMSFQDEDRKLLEK